MEVPWQCKIGEIPRFRFECCEVGFDLAPGFNRLAEGSGKMAMKVLQGTPEIKVVGPNTRMHMTQDLLGFFVPAPFHISEKRCPIFIYFLGKWSLSGSLNALFNRFLFLPVTQVTHFPSFYTCYVIQSTELTTTVLRASQHSRYQGCDVRRSYSKQVFPMESRAIQNLPMIFLWTFYL